MVDLVIKFVLIFIVMVVMMFVISLLLPTVVILNKAGFIFIAVVSGFYAVVDGD